MSYGLTFLVIKQKISELLFYLITKTDFLRKSKNSYFLRYRNLRYKSLYQSLYYRFLGFCRSIARQKPAVKLIPQPTRKDNAMELSRRMRSRGFIYPHSPRVSAENGGLFLRSLPAVTVPHCLVLVPDPYRHAANLRGPCSLRSFPDRTADCN